jgi:hypothetical protein
MNTSNLKDKLSTICGIIFALCTALITTGVSGVALPTWLTAGAGIVAAICGAIIGVLTGKAPNASTKSDSQVAAGNAK